ncbi:unnamed protein product, partial [Brassica rapa subsp. trilocularis]
MIENKFENHSQGSKNINSTLLLFQWRLQLIYKRLN